MSHVEDKIRKLLAIAECSTASSAERELAMEKAIALAEVHAVEISELGRDALKFGTSDLWENNGRRQPVWLDGVIQCTMRFNVRVLYLKKTDDAGRHRGWVVEAFGCEASRRVAEYVFTFLRREFLRKLKEYEQKVLDRLVREYDLPRFMWQGIGRKKQVEFLRGVAIGVCSKIEERRKAAAGIGNALVRVSRELENEFERCFGEVPVKKEREDLEDNRAGIIAGRSIELNQGIGTEGNRARRLGQ